MSRGGKNIVFPLDSLCKEKENTNRPTVSRSVGTFGKWGKMGFTSTRTYALTSLPASIAAAAAAAASPDESPASVLDDDMSPSVPEPPKPKKFFKSRNTTPPEVIAQMIQHLPRVSTSPPRDTHNSQTPGPSLISTPVHGREPIKLKIQKSNSAERKKKSPKKNTKAVKNAETDVITTPTTSTNVSVPKTITEIKPKKKKEEKKLKPEAPPSRIIARTRKTVNYCEDDDEERIPTPVKEIIPRSKREETVLPPPATPDAAPKTPEHPPIVLRISKGTSRLVSTDSEEQTPSASTSVAGGTSSTSYSPQHQQQIHSHDTEQLASTAISQSSNITASSVTEPIPPKIIVKPPKPPSPAPPLLAETSVSESNYGAPEINYCTVKISPDKPPKERLKLIIKTDVIRNALAAEAAAAAARASESNSVNCGKVINSETNDRPEREKRSKSKKQKHLKHEYIPPVPIAGPVEQLAPSGSEFKTPSPHLALGEPSTNLRTIISPPALSERDFDSQSSVLGSISSKGNSTPQLPPVVLEESCVVHSRGSSVITSDLETSQHSSLVAPPSDIESRLESMMMDDEVSQKPMNLGAEEPLQEDILAVLQGDESQVPKCNGVAEKTSPITNDKTSTEETSTRRITRGRGRAAIAATTSEKNTPSLDEDEDKLPTRTRARKAPAAAVVNDVSEDTPPPKRPARRGTKKQTEETSLAIETPGVVEQSVEGKKTATSCPPATKLVSKEETDGPLTTTTVRRGRIQRNVAGSNNNNLHNNNNNNINKIAANLSAKAKGAAIEAMNATNTSNQTTAAVSTRSYGRKRKNQQVMHLVQAPTDDTPDHNSPPAKLLNCLSGLPDETDGDLLTDTNSTSLRTTIPVPSDLHDNNSNSNSIPRSGSTAPISPPPLHDYKIKDKFKRTLTLDNQANNCNATVLTPPASAGHDGKLDDMEPEDHQRGSVKLVISKKKGSIFKSRALGPTDHSEQPGAAKRHLYKHRWDAEANGGITNDSNVSTTNAANDNTTQASTTIRTTSSNDDIFDDFGEENNSSHGNLRENASPNLTKLTRVVKPNPQAYSNPFDMDEEDGKSGNCLPSDTIPSTKMDRKAKDYYTVIRNVKSAHQIQEIGEYQEMDDDVEYILDTLQPKNPPATRCLSALQLASKCMTPAFRMHVRAHGVVTKFFKALSDANKDLSLGLCTSAIMYILSQEGLNMDLDRDSLVLMMNLLESEGVAGPSDRAAYERNKQKVRELCEEIKAQGKATHLNVDAITVGSLAMETLLSLTSKRAGEWFKEELRELGGLEHIIKTISELCRPVLTTNNSSTGIAWTQSLIDNMQTVERCLRVLENVTQKNEQNQNYILTYVNGSAVDNLCALYCLCDRELKLHPTTEMSTRDNPGVIMRELLIPVMNVLINLTHTFNPSEALGAETFGKRTTVIETSFHLLLQAPNYIPDRTVFELSMLVLSLLINLTMHTVRNRTFVMKSYAPPEFGTHYNEQQSKVTTIQAVMDYFYKCEELARLVEKNTDAYLDNTEKNKKKQEEVDETVNNLLQKAGHHMEHTLKGSYAGILIGHLITDSEENETIVRTHLRGNGFKEIISVLEKYYTFMNLTASSEASAVSHIKSTKKLMDYFKKRDLLYKMNEQSNDCALPLNLEKHNS